MLPNPYPWRELLFLIWKNLLGPFPAKRHALPFLPPSSVLNSLSGVESRLGFMGDIMDTHGYPLEVDLSVREFFQDVDLLIVNLEGIITGLQKPPFSLSHSEDIMESLSQIQSPARVALCVSNNHSGDFGDPAFMRSVEILRRNGFGVFGTKDSPSYIHGGRLQVFAASMWSNRKSFSPIAKLDDAARQLSSHPQGFNVLFPHWGYEMERWPRPEIVRCGHRLLGDWDLLFGHHSHVPQPVTAVAKGSVNKLLAYSGGDFATGIRSQKYRYGIIAKCEIGPLKSSPERLAVGAVEWMFTHVERRREREPGKRPIRLLVKAAPSCPYFRTI